MQLYIYSLWVKLSALTEDVSETLSKRDVVDQVKRLKNVGRIVLWSVLFQNIMEYNFPEDVIVTDFALTSEEFPTISSSITALLQNSNNLSIFKYISQ